MRTTVTIDGDVSALLRQAVRERGISFKQALNDAVRSGLRDGRPKARARRIRLPAYDMGAVNAGVNLDKALGLAAELEDQETLRKMGWPK
jgi:hypothetical protein